MTARDAILTALEQVGGRLEGDDAVRFAARVAVELGITVSGAGLALRRLEEAGAIRRVINGKRCKVVELTGIDRIDRPVTGRASAARSSGNTEGRADAVVLLFRAGFLRNANAGDVAEYVGIDELELKRALHRLGPRRRAQRAG